MVAVSLGLSVAEAVNVGSGVPCVWGAGVSRVGVTNGGAAHPSQVRTKIIMHRRGKRRIEVPRMIRICLIGVEVRHPASKIGQSITPVELLRQADVGWRGIGAASRGWPAHPAV